MENAQSGDQKPLQHLFQIHIPYSHNQLELPLYFLNMANVWFTLHQIYFSNLHQDKKSLYQFRLLVKIVIAKSPLWVVSGHSRCYLSGCVLRQMEIYGLFC